MANTQWSDAVAERVFADMMKKAKEDPAYRQTCLSNPHAAVKEVSGMDLPSDFKLNVVENQGASLTVVLPDLALAEELSERELEDVAGGGGCLIGTCGGTQICGGISNYCLFTCGGSAISP